MGHADYKVLQRYVRLATKRDLGPRLQWTDLIVAIPPSGRHSDLFGSG